MKFWEAMKAMEEGKKVRAVGWKPEYYIYLNEKFEIRDSDGFFANFHEVIHLKMDWEIYEEKKEVDSRFKEFYHYLKDENGFANGQYGDFIYERNEEDHLLAFYRQLLEMAKYYKLD